MVSQFEHKDAPLWHDDLFIGGHPALDFINTNSHRLNAALCVDRFNRAEKITAWLVYQDLLSVSQSQELLDLIKKTDSETGFVNTMQTLRNKAGNIFDALAANQTIPSRSLAVILSHASKQAIKIEAINYESYRASQFCIDDINTKSVSTLFALLILDAIFRLPAQRIHSCPGCGWVFYDHSKGGRRKWCDMKACGNRAKVAKHYHSHRH